MIKPATLKADILFAILAILIIILGVFYYNSLKQENIPVTEEELPEETVITSIEETTINDTEETYEDGVTSATEELPEEETTEEAEISETKKEVLVTIKRNSFEPEENYTVSKGTTITWKSVDSRLHRIACYDGKKRFFFSEILDENESTAYTFDKIGEFLCIDAVFGIRSHVFVKQKVRDEITGAFIGVGAAESVATKLYTSVLIVVSLTIFVSLYRRKWQTS